jgi:hypothetical protein
VFYRGVSCQQNIEDFWLRPRTLLRRWIFSSCQWIPGLSENSVGSEQTVRVVRQKLIAPQRWSSVWLNICQVTSSCGVLIHADWDRARSSELHKRSWSHHRRENWLFQSMSTSWLQRPLRCWDLSGDFCRSLNKFKKKTNCTTILEWGLSICGLRPNHVCKVNRWLFQLRI